MTQRISLLQLLNLQRVKPNPYDWPVIEERLAVALSQASSKISKPVVFLALHTAFLYCQHHQRFRKEYDPRHQAHCISSFSGYALLVSDCEEEFGSPDRLGVREPYFRIEAL